MLIREKIEETFEGNKFLTIPEALEAANTRKVLLQTTDVKSRKLIWVSKETMEEPLKTLNISPKLLARRTTAMWDVARELAGNFLTTKNVRIQTKYMGTRRIRITVNVVPVDTHEGQMWGSTFRDTAKWRK